MPRRDYAPRSHISIFGFIFGFFGLILKMIFVTALVMGISGWLGFQALKMYVKTEEVSVPNVRGMKIADAIDVLSTKKLSILKDRAESSGLVAPGEIIDQRPQAGVTAKSGTIVRVVISSGQANFVVPDLTGETRDNAVNKIKGARLEVGNITYMEDSKYAKDTVINQTPEKNKGLDQAVKVDLLISSGPPGSALTMPDLTGKSLAEAKKILANLKITDVVIEPPNAPLASAVLSQEPLMGKLAVQTQRVTLRVKK